MVDEPKGWVGQLSARLVSAQAALHRLDEARDEVCRELVEAAVAVEALQRERIGLLGRISAVPCEAQASAVGAHDVNVKPTLPGPAYRLATGPSGSPASGEVQTGVGRFVMLGRLASGVAHEINNPLSILISELESLNEELPLGAQPQTQSVTQAPGLSPADRLREARAAAERIRELTRGLNMFAQIGNSNPEQLDVRGEIEQAVSMARCLMMHRATLATDTEGNLPQVLATRGVLGQALLSLFVAAADAFSNGRSSGAEVLVRANASRGGVAVEVQASGAEEGDASRQDAFEMRTKSMMLSVAQEIVEGIGGEFALEGNSPRGSAFRFWLPAAPLMPAEPEVAPVRQMRLLVVDDEAGIRRTLARFMRDYELCEAGSGEEALRIIGQGLDFDGILCDVMMPSMSGIEFHRRLASEHPDLARKIVFMTGGVLAETMSNHLRTLGNPRIEKPFDPVNLRAVVRRFFMDASSAGFGVLAGMSGDDPARGAR